MPKARLTYCLNVAVQTLEIGPDLPIKVLRMNSDPPKSANKYKVSSMNSQGKCETVRLIHVSFCLATCLQWGARKGNNYSGQQIQTSSEHIPTHYLWNMLRH